MIPRYVITAALGGVVTFGLFFLMQYLIAMADARPRIDKRQVDPRALRANIERLKAENPQGSVIIQADKESKNGLLVKVMDAARRVVRLRDGRVVDDVQKSGT